MEKMKLKGSFDVKLFGPDGKLKQHETTDNLVVDAGFDGISQRCFSTETGSASFNYISIGSGASAAAAGDTTLDNVLATQQATYAHSDGDANFSLTTTFAAGVGTGSVNEYAVQNGSPTGTLFNRALTGLVTKNAADSLQIVFAGSLS